MAFFLSQRWDFFLVVLKREKESGGTISKEKKIFKCEKRKISILFLFSSSKIEIAATANKKQQQLSFRIFTSVFKEDSFVRFKKLEREREREREIKTHLK